MIRLQWWREAVDELVAGQAARRHPVVLALEGHLMSGAVAPEDLTALIDAREPALDGMADDMFAVERYAETTSGSLQSIVYKVLGGDNPTEARAAAEIGTGYGLARLADAVGGEARQWHERGSTATIAALRETMLARAAELLRSGRAQAGRPARRHMAAFLAGRIADAYLAQAHRSRTAGLARPAMMPLWLAARWIARRP